MRIEAISIEDLQAELKKRNRNKPKVLNTIDFSPLITICQEYIDALDEDGCGDNYDNDIFEKAMEVIFGEDVWTFINLCIND